MCVSLCLCMGIVCLQVNWCVCLHVPVGAEGNLCYLLLGWPAAHQAPGILLFPLPLYIMCVTHTAFPSGSGDVTWVLCLPGEHFKNEHLPGPNFSFLKGHQSYRARFQDSDLISRKLYVPQSCSKCHSLGCWRLILRHIKIWEDTFHSIPQAIPKLYRLPTNRGGG